MRQPAGNIGVCNNRKPFRKSVGTLFSAALVLAGLTGSTVAASALEAESASVEETPRQTSTVPETPAESDADDAPAEATKPAPLEPAPRQESTTKSPSEKKATTDLSPSASAEESESPEEETEVEPEETEATITVRVSDGLAGVKLRLHTGGASKPAAAIAESWASCTSNADGKCSFTIPDTHPPTDDYEQGENYDQRFWVVQESAPSGWYANSSLGLNSETPYRFRTGPALRAGGTYTSTGDFMHTDGSSGTWQNSRANPAAELSCKPGADVALILDRSGPVGNTPQLSAAAQAMKDRLDGSNSTARIIEASTEAGLAQVAGQSYDLAIVVGAGGKASNFAAVEKTIRTANAVKAQGTRILAVGIGPTSASNLQAIAGTQTSGSASYTGADVHTVGLGRLSMLLNSVADQLACETTVDITQKLTPYGEDARTAGSGWTFKVDAPKVTVSPKATQQTGDQGTVSYEVDFGSKTSADLTIESVLSQKQQASGWAAKNSTCEVNGTKVATETAAAEFSVTPGDRVECTFYAVQTLDPGLKVVKKAWDTDSVGELAEAPELPRGSSVSAGKTVTWTYLVTNTGQTPLDDVVVTDNQLPEDAIVCPASSLDVGKSMTCTATGVVTADH